ncbi:MAG: T9SS type A sorting domain-containing protein [Chitinophagales bacterium]
MKKLSGFLVLICSFCGLQSQTNVYHKFLTEGAEWSELVISYSFEYDSITYIQHEGIFGDTIIDGKLYYIMGSFLMREDTINKKVYAQELAFGWPDTLLYDFNLNIGESAAHCAEFSVANLFPDATVTNIDSIFIGKYRKRWEIKYTPLVEEGDSVTYWIEGIGSDYGIFTPYGSWYWPDIRRLICYKENDSVLFSDLQFYYDCDGIFEDTSINIFENIIEPTFVIQPNPADKLTQIILPNESNVIKQLAVFNVRNQLVFEGKFIEDEFNMNCSGFYPGIYFIVITEGQKKYYNKLVVTH